MNFKNVTIAGSGVLGYQIAFQCAFHGFNVTVYDINDEVLEKAKAKFDGMADNFKRDLNATQEQLDATFKNLHYNSNLAEAVKFYQKLAKVAPEKTIFASNSSTLLPSQFAEYTGRPEKFLAFHFANEIWKHNTGEVMKHPGTSQEVFDAVLQFAKEIGMVALPINKEQPGYIVNSLLVPLLSAAMELWVKEVADIETIDKTWMVATGAPTGPFGILDVVGITTAYNINKMEAEATQDPDKLKIVETLKSEFIDKGKLGVFSGEGFYKYPNPSYQEKDFLK